MGRRSVLAGLSVVLTAAALAVTLPPYMGRNARQATSGSSNYIPNPLAPNDTVSRVLDNSGEPALIIRFRVVKLYSCIEFAELSIIQWMIQRETIAMNTDQTVQLIGLLSKKRAESGLSVNEVARRAKLPVSVVWKIEQGMIATPKAESLLAIGKVLGIPAIDLFAIVGWLPSDQLPSMGPYLRAKYRQLPAEALQELEDNFHVFVRRYRTNLDTSAPQLADAAGGTAP